MVGIDFESVLRSAVRWLLFLACFIIVGIALLLSCYPLLSPLMTILFMATYIGASYLSVYCRWRFGK